MYWALIPLNKGVKGAPTRARESKLVVPSVIILKAAFAPGVNFIIILCTNVVKAVSWW